MLEHTEERVTHGDGGEQTINQLVMFAGLRGLAELLIHSLARPMIQILADNGLIYHHHAVRTSYDEDRKSVRLHVETFGKQPESFVLGTFDEHYILNRLSARQLQRAIAGCVLDYLRSKGISRLV